MRAATLLYNVLDVLPIERTKIDRLIEVDQKNYGIVMVGKNLKSKEKLNRS